MSTPLGYNDAMHQHLRQLERIWIDFPIYAITACVRNRKAVLSRGEAAQILVQEWRAAHTRHGLGDRSVRYHAGSCAFLLPGRNWGKDII